MKTIFGATLIAASAMASACTPATETLTLTGRWEGEITCYQMASPLTMTVDAATPLKAALAMGAQGALTWDADVSIDTASRVATIKSTVPTGDAETISGPLSADGKTISGEMPRQLCNRFSLTRAT
jgi:hypothetical protein